MSTYQVEIRKMDGSDTRFQDFVTYKEALIYYSDKCSEKLHEHDVQWPAAGVEVELEAGGIGREVRISLLIIEEED